MLRTEGACIVLAGLKKDLRREYGTLRLSFLEEPDAVSYHEVRSLPDCERPNLLVVPSSLTDFCSGPAQGTRGSCTGVRRVFCGHRRER